jgi:hypothetical protein
VAGACDPFNEVFSGSLSNGVVSDDPFNGAPSLGEGETNDGADARLELKSRGRHSNGSCPFACLNAFNVSRDTLSLSALSLSPCPFSSSSSTCLEGTATQRCQKGV